jgi:hypothetical protein
MQYDFRSVYFYTSGIGYVYRVQIELVMLQNFESAIIQSTACLPTNEHEANNAAGENLIIIIQIFC